MNSQLLRIACLFVVIALLSACATGNSPRPEVAAALKPGTSKIVIYREAATTAMFAGPSVLINDVDVGKLNNASYIEVAVAPGTYTLTFVGNFFNWPWPARTLKLVAPPNGIAYAQLLVVSTGGNFSVLERMPSEATVALEKLKR